MNELMRRGGGGPHRAVRRTRGSTGAAAGDGPPSRDASTTPVTPMSDRPSLGPTLTEHEFRRWYWTMAELQPFARSLGLSAIGPKADLTSRIAARLAGRPTPESPRRRPTSPPLDGPLTLSTMIPTGQRSTQELRAFFMAEIGPGFRFNGHMRAFLLAGGATLGDAVEHWHRTVGSPLPAPSESLEFNQFTRAWHAANPGGTAAQCRTAWAAHRSLPADQRPPIG